MTFIQSGQVAASAGVASGDTPQTRRVRFGLLALGCVLGLYALWQLTAELIHPAVPYFFSATEQDASRAPAAALAAEIAVFRSDFWFDDALLKWIGAASAEIGAGRSSALDDVRVAAARAARLAPHDARAWLLLALADAHDGLDSRQQTEALRMSYYTGANDLALIPERMKLAVRSPAMTDTDFQNLVAGEVLSIVRRPALQSVIVSSYRQASPDGKRFLKSYIGPLDAALLAQMQATDSDPLRY
jgi:hypothetical protein